MMRKIVLFFLLVLLLVSGGLVHYFLQDHIWGVLSADRTRVEAMTTGWSILIEAWPIALGGFVAFGLPLLLFMSFLWAKAEETDEKNRIDGLLKRIDDAEQRVLEADQQAESRLSERETRVSQMELEAAEQHHEALKIREAAKKTVIEIQGIAETKIEKAQQLTAKAITQAEEADNRRKRAFNGFRRMERKVKKLQHQISKYPSSDLG